MNGCVDKLFDIDSVKIPDELTKIEIDDTKIDNEVSLLAMRYANEYEASSVALDDIVYCTADDKSYPDKRTIIIYTGVALPDANHAAKAVIGKNVGDSVKTQIADKAATLTIYKIIRRTPAKIDDGLIGKIGIDGVTTVDDYKAYIKSKMVDDAKMEQSKAAIGSIMDQMVQNSTYTYDEAEMDEYINSCTEDYEKECREMGMEPNADELRDSIIFQQKQYWMAQAFCENKNIEIDLNDVEEQAKQMIEMSELMGEAAPSLEEAVEIVRQDAYLTAFFEYVNNIISQKTEA